MIFISLKKINVLLLAALQIFCFQMRPQKCIAQNSVADKKTFADHWKFISVAVQEQGYHIWGTSPVMGDDG